MVALARAILKALTSGYLWMTSEREGWGQMSRRARGSDEFYAHPRNEFLDAGELVTVGQTNEFTPTGNLLDSL